MRCSLNSIRHDKYDILKGNSAQRVTASSKAASGIKFDVMIQGRWVATMNMPCGFPVDYEGDKPVFNLRKGQLEQFVEQQKPSLVGKPWYAEQVVKETKELWRQ